MKLLTINDTEENTFYYDPIKDKVYHDNEGLGAFLFFGRKKERRAKKRAKNAQNNFAAEQQRQQRKIDEIQKLQARLAQVVATNKQLHAQNNTVVNSSPLQKDVLSTALKIGGTTLGLTGLGILAYKLF